MSELLAHLFQLRSNLFNCSSLDEIDFLRER